MSYTIACQIDETMMGDEPMNTSPTVLPMPRLKKKKDIVYGHAPKRMVEMIRKQLLEMVNAKDLEDQLGTIGRFASQAEDMLMMVRKPEARMRSEHEITVPGVMSDASTAENYGSTMLRQLIPALSQYMKASKETPEMLVQAMVIARQAGMPDVAAEIERKMFGKTLDGARPVAFQLPTGERALTDTTTTKAIGEHAPMPRKLKKKIKRIAAPKKTRKSVALPFPDAAQWTRVNGGGAQ